MRFSLAPDDEPTSLEKITQMDRILASDTFKRLVIPARLLRHLGECHLTGVEPDEHGLGVKLFERKHDWITDEDNIVRQNMTRLRKLVESYYADEGVEDRLNLELPGYKLRFSYNLRNPVTHTMRRAARFIGTDPFAAFSLLDSVLSLERNHAEAWAGRAETEMWRTFVGRESGLSGGFETVIEQAESSLQSDSGCWRAHVVMGAVFCCRCEWGKAQIEFDSALENSPSQTRAHPWYVAYLMAIGSTEEALELAKAKASEPLESAWPQLAYAIFLYAARRYKEAKWALHKGHAELRHLRIYDVMTYLVQFAETPLPTSGDRIHLGAMAEVNLESFEKPYPVFQLLTWQYSLDPEYFQFDLVKGAMEDIAISKLKEWESDLSPFQRAIGYMAIGDSPKATELLRVDLERGHPFMAWLHLWPLFDPLRETQAFRDLIASMNLPTRK